MNRLLSGRSDCRRDRRSAAQDWFEGDCTVKVQHVHFHGVITIRNNGTGVVPRGGRVTFKNSPNDTTCKCIIITFVPRGKTCIFLFTKCLSSKASYASILFTCPVLMGEKRRLDFVSLYILKLLTQQFLCNFKAVVRHFGKVTVLICTFVFSATSANMFRLNIFRLKMTNKRHNSFYFFINSSLIRQNFQHADWMRVLLCVGKTVCYVNRYL